MQREALRAIVQIGTNEAYQMLEQALKSGAAHTREAIMQALGAFRDEKAAPLFVYILTNTDYKGRTKPSTRRRSSRSARSRSTSDRCSTLKDILYRGEWWAPGRNARIRAAAARALRSMGTAERRSHARGSGRIRPGRGAQDRQGRARRTRPAARGGRT